MKKIFVLWIVTAILLSTNSVGAYTNSEKLAADFLSYKDIIVVQEDADKYQLDKEITRREMAKVTLNLSWKNVVNKCHGLFDDLQTGDWGCKYAETWLANSFFARNDNFNPNNSISKIEALKMVMKGREIEKQKSPDWREGYVTAAVTAGLLESEFSDYDTLATRWWIFIIAQHAIEYGEGKYEDEDIKLFEDLLDNLLK